jgi:hypothetical protein
MSGKSSKSDSSMIDKTDLWSFKKKAKKYFEERWTKQTSTALA